MKYFFAIISFIVIPFVVFSNAAMPGLWNTGYGGGFLPLIAADSSNFGKVQMKTELVLIDLYPGFSVVKGTYNMYNTEDTAITMYTGYPHHGQYDQTLVDNVVIGDAPYNLKVLVNGTEVLVTKYNDSLLSANSLATTSIPVLKNRGLNQVWHLWKMKFEPKKITTITVYFLTNNSQAKLRKGYSISKGHAFGYVLESGKAWAGKIDTGNIYVRLMDGLTIKNIAGVMPDTTYKENTNKLGYSFINKEPEPSDNLLIWYNKNLDSIDFQKIIPIANNYFNAINNFNLEEFRDINKWKIIQLSDFKPKDSGLGIFFMSLLIGGILFATLAMWGFIKLIKRISQNRNND